MAGMGPTSFRQLEYGGPRLTYDSTDRHRSIFMESYVQHREAPCTRAAVRMCTNGVEAASTFTLISQRPREERRPFLGFLELFLIFLDGGSPGRLFEGGRVVGDCISFNRFSSLFFSGTHNTGVLIFLFCLSFALLCFACTGRWSSCGFLTSCQISYPVSYSRDFYDVAALSGVPESQYFVAGFWLSFGLLLFLFFELLLLLVMMNFFFTIFF